MIKKIGWEKYEHTIQRQMNHPLTSSITINNINAAANEEEEEENEFDLDFDFLNGENEEITIVPVPNYFFEQIELICNYDCWIGHTNFDITGIIKNIINKTQGVEVLKIMSRYRFFVGVGKMFEFSDVRKEIEEKIK